MRQRTEKIGRQFDPGVDIPHKKGDLFTPNAKVHWLNPIAMSQLRKAVMNRNTSVVLNGDIFDITYGIIIELLDGPRECIKLKRSDGSYVPFGYIGIDSIKRFQFEEGRD